eukprot:Skav216693  [mRNA]  locus=scaffold91:225288:226114:+ [translate_table: standard]
MADANGGYAFPAAPRMDDWRRPPVDDGADPYVEQLIRSRPSSGSPLIHRGYWSRVEAIRQSVLRFVQAAPERGGVQVEAWRQLLAELRLR